MMMKNEVVRQWIEKAEHDLINGRHTMTLADDCPYDTVCFHAQQAAEKLLKAMLSHLGIEFTKIHDITVLVDLLPKTSRPGISVEEQARLTQWAVAARYPGVEEEPSRQDAAEALRLAEAIKVFVGRDIG